MKTVENIHVHRFAGNAAVTLGDNATVYLTQDKAAWLAAQLKELVVDIEHRNDVRSTYASTDYLTKRSSNASIHRNTD